MSNREHLEEVERQTGVAPVELVQHPMPEMLEHVWDWWCRLHAMRPDGGMQGFGSIGWSNIDAFNRLLGLRMAPEEVELVELIELEYRRYATARGDGHTNLTESIAPDLPTLPDSIDE